MNFASERFCNLIELETAEKWEPPVTKDLSEEVILSALAQPLILEATIPSQQHTSSGVVTEVAPLRVGYDGRHRLIVQKLKSRKLCGSFNSVHLDVVLLPTCSCIKKFKIK